MSARQLSPEVAAYIDGRFPQHQEIIHALIDAVTRADPGIEDAIKVCCWMTRQGFCKGQGGICGRSGPAARQTSIKVP